MISFEKETHVVTIWYVGGTECDWLACLTRESDGSHVVRYRFRYYADNKAFDSEDEKNWWAASWPADKPVATAVEACDEVAAKASADSGHATVYKMEINGDGEKALRILSEQPFVHMREGSP